MYADIRLVAMPKHPNFTARLSTQARARLSEARALSKLDGKRHSLNAVIVRVMGVYCAKARMRLRARGKDVDGTLERLRAGVVAGPRPAFTGVPEKAAPRVYEH